ncbi:NAD 5'-nucleotidase [Seminavis robusta]|uniref:NAD 5'-nucleotidase n=1 Tax=Seminavis robusta TaxID=568900 RepID=A0A9N8DZB3_9STRA|nr:NAD 5'-nucleotidase [Seminavis robusta]|eukprot:Sro387_g132140.1 NAD 5'-nucleotidase (728) ;mRNA; r:44107-46466
MKFMTAVLAALSAPILQANAQQVVSLIHINDHHSHFDESALTLSEEFIPPGLSVETSELRLFHGGAPRVANQIDAFRQESLAAGNDVCVVHAGDALTGTSYYSFYGPSMDAAFMNTVQFDVMVTGNHEFDDGDENLANFTRMLDATTVISYNLIPHADSALLQLEADKAIQPYFIKELSDGTQMGFCGITTKVNTEQSSFPDPGTTFLEEVAATEACVDELTGLGIDKIIAITHLGYDEDVMKISAIEGVDVIIGGHTHSLLGDEKTLGLVGLNPEAPYGVMVNGTCIAQAWEYNKIVGKLDITFDVNGDVESCEGTLAIPLNPDVFTVRDADPRYDLEASDASVVVDYLTGLGVFTDPGESTQVIDVLQPFRDEVDSFLEQPIATAAENICHTRAGGAHDPNCPGKEDLSAVGGGACLIVSQGFLYNVPNADFAIQNSGGCREGILAGSFTYGDAYTILPFSNTLVTFDMTGNQIRRVLEDSVNFFLNETIGGGGGSYPVSAGLRWHVNYTKPFGERFSNIEINPRLEGDWEPLDLEEVYTVVTNDFIAAPRDGYYTFAEIQYENTYVLYTQSLIDYVTELQVIIEPLRNEYSTQVLTVLNGTTYDVRKPSYEEDVVAAPAACTLELMTCPDGSSVGRTGPDCEFEPCPAVEVEVARQEGDEEDPMAELPEEQSEDTAAPTLDIERAGEEDEKLLGEGEGYVSAASTMTTNSLILGLIATSTIVMV